MFDMIFDYCDKHKKLNHYATKYDNAHERELLWFDHGIGSKMVGKLAMCHNNYKHRVSSCIGE